MISLARLHFGEPLRVVGTPIAAQPTYYLKINRLAVDKN